MPTDIKIFDDAYKGKVIHFSGIGGVSMSGLAAILNDSGYAVQGSDRDPGDNLKELIEKGVRIFKDQSGDNLKTADVFVRSLAIKEDNEEYIAAKNKEIPIISRHELLGQIMDNYRYSVAVSGTHGKTTASSMIGYILKLSKLDPALNIGSDLFYEKHGTHPSNSDYFVAEACEYGNSFHEFRPHIGVVLNIEADHLDFFKDLDDVKKGFSGFINNIKDDGYVVYFSGDKNTTDMIISSNKKPISFGYSKNDNYMANNIKTKDHMSTFSVYKNGKMFGNFKLNVPGLHNLTNALCAIAVCDLLEADIHFIKSALLTFKGATRRLEKLGTTKEGYVVYDDYAHHPTEIKASLGILSQIKKGRLICAFQPHTYTRTLALFDDFIKAFKECDVLIITDIYSAREKDVYGISSDDLSKKVDHPNALYIPDLKEAKEYIQSIANKDDLIVSMGAGDIFKVTYPLIDRKI